MLGYWRNPEATAAAIGPGRWLRTGDVGHLDDGRLYLSSRRRDLILRGGENVYPIEVEKAIEDHPDVAECAVFGVDDPEFGQAVKAVVVSRAGAVLDVETLRAFTAAAISYYKVPTQWELRAEPLPRNASGKLTKEPLRTGAQSNFVEE
jgi:acyl-CoA synthetase (AMP-forming)/AMP-acid ligase II